MAGGTGRPGGRLEGHSDPEARGVGPEVEEEGPLDSLGVDQGAGQAHHPFELSARTNQSQDTREQASRDQGQRGPGQGRAEGRNKSPVPREAPIQARQLGNGERGRGKAVPGYLRWFPVLMRGRTKLEAKRSWLDDVVSRDRDASYADFEN